MIFVTTGTHYLPFDRLIKMVSLIRGNIPEDIVIQSGSSKIRVRGAIQQDYFPFNEIIEYLKKAKVIISHAGPATVFQSLFMAGKVPIVVPRRKEYGEHVSNHQVFFAEYLEKSGRGILVESEDELQQFLLNSTTDFKSCVTLKITSSLERKLAGYLNNLKKNKKINKMLKITLAVVSSFLTLIVTDFIINLAGYEKTEVNSILRAHDIGFYQSDRALIYKISPERSVEDQLWASNSFGFRFNPYHSNLNLKIGSEVTIVATGDSFTYGHGVKHNEAFPAILERLLKPTLGESLMVHNAGVPGYGPDQEYIQITRKIIPKLYPNVLIWTLSLNDIGDANDKCLYFKFGNYYLRIPALLNTGYYRELAATKIPRRILLNSSLIDIISRFLLLVGKNDFFTVGCSQMADSEANTEKAIKKIGYFLQKVMNTAKRDKFIFIVALAPMQSYFDYENNETSPSMSSYLKLKNIIVSEIGTENLVDANEEIINRDKVLGSESRWSQTLFLQEDDFPYGSRHLGARGNEVFAELIRDKIRSIYRK